MDIKQLVNYLSESENISSEGLIDSQLEIIIKWIRQYFIEYKKGRSEAVIEFCNERETAFQDIEQYLRGLTEAEINIVKGKINIILRNIYGYSKENGENDFDARFKRNDSCDIISIYLLLIKNNKDKIFQIEDNKFYMILNSASRGDRVANFNLILDIISNPKFLKLINMGAFINGNERILLDVSNAVGSNKEKDKLQDIDKFISEFIQGKIDMTKFITKDMDSETVMRSKLEQNKQYNIETINKAEKVNSSVYNRYQKLITAFDRYDNMNNEQAEKYLNIVESIGNRGNLWGITQYQLIILTIMAKIDILDKSDDELKEIAAKLYNSSYNEYDLILNSLENSHKKM